MFKQDRQSSFNIVRALQFTDCRRAPLAGQVTKIRQIQVELYGLSCCFLTYAKAINVAGLGVHGLRATAATKALLLWPGMARPHQYQRDTDL
ncbi:hypothetical protein [Pseudomonas koreensis]